MSQAQEISIDTVNIGGEQILWPRLSRQRAIDMCEEKKVTLDGHFILKSGFHSI